MRGIARIAVEVLRVKDRVNLVTHAGIGGGEYGRNTSHSAAVIIDSLDSGFCGISRSDGAREDEDVFALDHRRCAIAEYYLAAGGIFGSEYVDGLVRVEVVEIRTGKLFCEAGAYDLRTVKAKNCIDDGGRAVIADELLGKRCCFGKSCLLCCYVDEIVDMAMACCKMPGRNAQKKVFTLGADFERIVVWHIFPLFLSFYHI